MRKTPASPSALDRRLKLATKTATLLGADENTAYLPPAEGSDRGDEIEAALPSCQPAGKHHYGRPVGQPPLAGEAGNPRRTDPGGVEDLEIDAARDDAQPVGADAIDARGMVSDEARNRDDPFAARHDGIIPALERGTRVISIMEGGDKMRPGGARCRPGAPRRGPAAGVNNVDAELRDQPHQGMGVAAHDQRVFRGERQGQVAGSGSRHVALQWPTARRDIRDPPGGRQRSRQFDGAALGPTGDKAWQDLQHRRWAACGGSR